MGTHRRLSQVLAVVSAALVSACAIGGPPTPTARSLTWTTGTVDGADRAQVSHMSVNVQGFLAVGDRGYAGPGVAWTSTDATTWHETSAEEALADTPLCLG